MAQFALLLYDDPSGWLKLSPEEMQKTLEKYTAWGKQQFIKASQRLAEDSGKVLRSAGGKPRAADGPYSETKEILGGFYLIEAADYEEAVERSLGHPHLEHGTIEIRKLYGQ
jgi:hypothetical protein